MSLIGHRQIPTGAGAGGVPSGRQVVRWPLRAIPTPTGEQGPISAEGDGLGDGSWACRNGMVYSAHRGRSHGDWVTVADIDRAGKSRDRTELLTPWLGLNFTIAAAAV